MVLVVASCSKSVSTGTSGSSTTSHAQSTTTTTAKSTSTTKASKAVTSADLEKLLPKAADVGGDYRVVSGTDGKSSSEDAAIDDAIKQACPELADVMKAPKDSASDPNTVSRDFDTEDGRSVGVELKAGLKSSSVPDRAAMKKLVDGVSKCGTVKFDSSGISFSGTLLMQADDSIGDFGAVLKMTWTGVSDELPKPLVIDALIRMVAVGDVGVTISAFGGVDTTTMEGIPVDADIVDRLAKDLAGSVGSLQGS